MSSSTLLRPHTVVAPRASTRPGWPRKVVAVAMMLIGVTFVAVTLAANLFKVGPAFDDLTDGFRPVMTQSTVDAARADIAALAAAGTEFQTKLAPAMAAQLKVTPAELSAMFATQFPDVTAGVQALPQVVPQFSSVVTTIDEQRPLFRSADAIPTRDLPATTLPWTLLVVGILVFGLGVYTWFALRAGSVIAVVLGAMLIALPLLMSLPDKAADADQMNANLEPVYTQQLVTDASGALTTLSAMGTELQTEMLPMLATQLKMQPAQLQAFMAESFPATAAVVSDMPAAMWRFETLISAFRAHLDDYDTLKPVELVPLVRMMIGGGIALMLLGLIGLALPRLRFGATR